MFDDTTLVWQGQTYKIPANRMLKAVAAVETHLTLTDAIGYMADNSIPFAKISQAYAAALRQAGHGITAEEVYLDLISKPDDMTQAVVFLEKIMEMMIPSSVRDKAKGGDAISTLPLSRENPEPLSRKATKR